MEKRFTTAPRACAIALLCMLAAGCAPAGPSAHAQIERADNSITGVASVIDGDTIEVHGARVRLSGFDSPERGARCSGENVYQRAANELDRFIAGRTVQCVSSGTDRYERTVATCSVAGTDLGDHLVREGWARDWPRYSHGAYAGAEQEARQARRGLWGLSCPTDLWGDRDYSR